ncbi:phage Gp37/Gp68 family protein [Burkholderia semiarida]|uniref:phage Gp37/Gp68 family protein n=1 Tax=Burkholderia semiarida TaxID=2843303 RepID=UPI0023DD89D4|nr:phage Gp37/Gp68 family protein [Burkholderia semiarida]MDF3115823.1 phage Gp37/Gp68 family protein [Burkholderia semiarida]
MSENTKIEWCDHTFNPWEGCQKVGPGCDHCYAETRNARFGGGTALNWGPGAPRRRTSAANWRKPVQWNRDGTFYAIHGRRQRVFCASLADVFDNEVDLLWRRDLFRLMADTKNLDWLLLTKRIGNVPAMLRHIGVERLPDNVWLGATIVNQAEADRDIPKLLSVPARMRFLSMEPLLGSVDLTSIPWGGLRVSALQGWSSPEHGLHWVIVGGESGPGARPMHPDWARDLRDQCAVAGVPFLFKQWGEWADHDQPGVDMLGTVHSPLHKWPDGKHSVRLGKRAAGRHLDGRAHDEFPEAR